MLDLARMIFSGKLPIGSFYFYLRSTFLDFEDLIGILKDARRLRMSFRAGAVFTGGLIEILVTMSVSITLIIFMKPLSFFFQ